MHLHSRTRQPHQCAVSWHSSWHTSLATWDYNHVTLTFNLFWPYFLNRTSTVVEISDHAIRASAWITTTVMSTFYNYITLTMISDLLTSRSVHAEKLPSTMHCICPSIAFMAKSESTKLYDFEHFWSSLQQINGCHLHTSCNFLLVFYSHLTCRLHCAWFPRYWMPKLAGAITVACPGAEQQFKCWSNQFQF